MSVYEAYKYYIKIRDGTTILNGKECPNIMIKVLLKKVSKNFLKNIEKIR